MTEGFQKRSRPRETTLQQGQSENRAPSSYLRSVIKPSCIPYRENYDQGVLLTFVRSCEERAAQLLMMIPQIIKPWYRNGVLTKADWNSESDSDKSEDGGVFVDFGDFDGKITIEKPAQKPAFHSQSSPASDVACRQEQFKICQYDGPFDTRPPEIAAKASPFVAGHDIVGQKLRKPPFPMEVTSFVSSPEDVFQTQLDDAASAVDESLYPTSLLSANYDERKNEYSRETQHRKVWDPVNLLNLADALRNFIDKRLPLNDTDLEMLLVVLEDILKHEAPGEISIDFPAIVFSRFEKVIDGLIAYKKKGQLLPGTFGDVISRAILLQRSWQKRFQGRFFTIMEERVKQMIKPGGALAHVVLRSSKDGNCPVWVADGYSPAGIMERRHFTVGQWWMNIQCAYRDGMVNSMDGNRRYGTIEMPTITLLQGIETFDKESSCWMWAFEGRLQEMQLHSQEKVGKKFRMLRGYRLKSMNSPEAGIRYDGIYILRRYSHKMIDQKTALFSVVLRYDEIQGQSGIDKDAVTPSRMDDWNMYKRIEDEEIRKACDLTTYNSWRGVEEQEQMAVRDWLQRQKFRDMLTRVQSQGRPLRPIAEHRIAA